MFDLLLQLSPPPSGIATLSNEKVAEQLAHHLANVASTGAELFLRCQLTAMEWERETQSLRATARDQGNQLESRREQISHLDAQLYSLGQYPNSDQFRRDAIAYFVSRPSEVPGLLFALCPSEDAAIPLFHMFREDPVISAMIRKVTAWGYLKGTRGMQQTLYHILKNALPKDWESVRTVLPEDLTSPGPEPFKKPPTDGGDVAAAVPAGQWEALICSPTMVDEDIYNCKVIVTRHVPFETATKLLHGESDEKMVMVYSAITTAGDGDQAVAWWSTCMMMAVAVEVRERKIAENSDDAGGSGGGVGDLQDSGVSGGEARLSGDDGATEDSISTASSAKNSSKSSSPINLNLKILSSLNLLRFVDSNGGAVGGHGGSSGNDSFPNEA
nr:uncharacterized protein LOC109149872 [Ipomoea batatas]